jgi:hypothetical protein
VADVPASCLGGRDFPIVRGFVATKFGQRKPPFAARAQPSLSRIARFLGISRPKASLPGIPFQFSSRYLAERTSPGVGPSIASVYFNRRMAASDFGGQFFARVGD